LKTLSLHQKRLVGFTTIVGEDSAIADEGLYFTLPNGCANVAIICSNVLLFGAILSS
jgi:hypothetical protein